MFFAITMMAMPADDTAFARHFFAISRCHAYFRFTFSDDASEDDDIVYYLFSLEMLQILFYFMMPPNFGFTFLLISHLGYISLYRCLDIAR